MYLHQITITKLKLKMKQIMILLGSDFRTESMKVIEHTSLDSILVENENPTIDLYTRTQHTILDQHFVITTIPSNNENADIEINTESVTGKGQTENHIAGKVSQSGGGN